MPISMILMDTTEQIRNEYCIYLHLHIVSYDLVSRGAWNICGFCCAAVFLPLGLLTETRIEASGRSGPA